MHIGFSKNIYYNPSDKFLLKSPQLRSLATRATDGKKYVQDNLFHSKTENNPFMTVDLGAVRSVWGIAAYPRLYRKGSDGPNWKRHRNIAVSPALRFEKG